MKSIARRDFSGLAGAKASLASHFILIVMHRYAWAERAKVAGYPERFAQMALGHNSKAVHRAYARNAQVVLPPLEDYERNIVPLNACLAEIVANMPKKEAG